jgi:hypothetical protein
VNGVYLTLRRVCAIAFSCAAAAIALPLHAQQASEVQVSTVGFGDIEFDWGRDGINCPTCNFGQGNSRFNWTDKAHNLWVGHVDPSTGNFDPPAGNNELVDTYSYFWRTWGNGPEWAFSTQNGEVISQLVYTRYPRAPHVVSIAGAAFATMVNGAWQAQFLPGAVSSSGNSRDVTTILPEASQCNSDPVSLVIFHNVAVPAQSYTEPVTSAAGTAPTLTPFGAYANGLGERWVPCTHQMLFQGSAPPNSEGAIYQQVFWYDTDTQLVQQETFDSYGKHTAFMFEAPDFNHNYIFFTISGSLEIDVYEQTGVFKNGAPKFALVNQIRSPDSTEPYINSPEPFINCTPTCTTYIFMTLSSTNNSQLGHTIPNGVAVAALNPATPLFKILVPASSLPAAQRLDPEYFITANGPYLYYQLGLVETATKPFHNLGEYYSDMQLGAPSGPCVGSSAEGGLMPGC